MNKRTEAARLVAFVVFVLLGYAACSIIRLGEPLKNKAELDARPTSAVMVARYEEMQQRIRTALDAEFGPRGWTQTEPEHWGACGQGFAPAAGGRTVWLRRWDFDGSVTAQQWPRATEIINAVIAEYGFRPGGLALNGAGESDTRLLNAFDTELDAHFEFGTQLATTMQVTTGCHPAGPPS